MSSIISVRPDGSPGPALGTAEEYASDPSWGSDGSFVVADSGGALQLAYPGAYPLQGELATLPNSESSALRPDAGGPLAYATGTAYGTGDLYIYQQDTPVWDWTDVPAYWAAEFGGTPQSGCGVAHPTWFQGTLGAADTTPPTVNCAAPDASWHATDVTIACTASDSGSGLASSADASFTLTTAVPAGTETATAATGTRSVCDVAGNCTTAGPVTGIKVDKAPPKVVITSPTSGASVAQGAALTAMYSCTDGGSGIATCVGPVASGAALDTSTPGPHTVTVTGRDAVGNSASASVTYTVTSTAPALPTISIADASAREGNSTIGNLLLFRITLSKPASGNVRVTATPRPGTATATSDYFAVPLTLTLRPGQTTVLYPVLIRGDRVVEPDETMTVTLSGVTGAVVGRAVATGTIVNDDR